MDRANEATNQADRWIVALGASAGGLAAFERFFRAVEPGSGLAFVVVQHLSPEHESILPRLLSAFTQMPVESVADGTVPIADRIYVIPPGTTLIYREGRLCLDTLEPRSTRHPISAFFSSLAAEAGPNAVAVVLSGTGSDGTEGLRAVQARGGLTIVQSPSEAQYDSMPRSALATGDVDMVVSAADMPALIVREMRRRAAEPRVTRAAAVEPLSAITESLRRQTGKEFGSFKRMTLLRRVQRRLAALGISGLLEYRARLDVDEAEARKLATDLMIGVTRFFRDHEAFEALEKAIIPGLFEFAGDQPARIWVPGCSSGEEAYSVALQLSHHARRLAQPSGGPPRFQVFATDINDAALAVARAGRYPATIARDVPSEWLEQYFVAEDGGYAVKREIRDSCIFSVHDVLRDPPFSRIDLISCRNLLIYIDPSVQSRLFPMFHYALRPAGFLFLGGSETVGDLSTLFEALDKKHRIFRKSAAEGRPIQFPLAISGGTLRTERSSSSGKAEGAQADGELVRALMGSVLEDWSTAVALVDSRGIARYFGGSISRYLPTPTGAPTTNVLELASGDLRRELSAALQAVAAGLGQVRRELAVGVEQDGTPLELTVKPFVLPGAPRDLFLVQLREAPAQAPQPPSGSADERTRELEGELRVATDRWRNAVRDLEGTNEELRSANEELQTMNEELQSSNEELQLSQEELQSVNEELNTVNAELAAKVEEVNGLYADLKNLFQSARIATVVLDRELRLTRFTPAASRLYPLADADIGRPLSDLANPFAGASVLSDAQAVLEDLTPRERILELADASGWHLLRALPYLSLSRSVDGVVLTFVDVTELKRTEAALREAQEREGRRAAELEAIMRSVPAAVFIARDADATRVVGNDAAYQLLRMPPRSNLSFAVTEESRPRFRILRRGRELAPEELALQRAAATGSEARDVEEEVHFADGTHVHLLGHALPLLDGDLRPAGAVAAYMDVTPLKDVEDSLRASEARFRGALQALLDAFAVFRPVIGSDGEPVDFELAFLNAPARSILRAGDGQLRLRELVPDRSPLLEVLSEAIGRGAAVERLDTPGAAAGSQVADRLYTLRASPVASGEVVVAWRDVTDRARALQALREADRRKDEFLAILGHELRNPLAALQTALQLEHRKGGSRGQQDARYLDLMGRQVRTLGRLVDDLLDVTRITRGKIHLQLRSVDLVEILRAEHALHEQAAGSRLRLAFTAPPTPLWVTGDPERIAQIAGNLITNACKFSEAGGHVEVSVDAGTDGRAELSVRDHGIGMAREALAHVFEPFWQADPTIDRARGGLGLGLSLVKGMADLMGAEVTARSDGPGLGSEFRVRFAPSEPPQAAEGARGKRPHGRSGRSLRILVVEDNDDVRESLVEYLAEERGHDVRSAHDGESGLAMAREWSPDLVLCDVGLPRLDGYAFARIARSTPSLARTVLAAMTGYGSDGDRKRAHASGFHHHFTKPLDLDALERFLEAVPVKAL